MLSLMYCSVSTLSFPRAVDEVASIVEASIARNAALGVTGALIYTGSYFAQALEGDEERVDELVTSIYADRRHCELTEVHRELLATRRFSSWNMAYGGPAKYIDRPIKKLFVVGPDVARARAVQHVYDLMAEFAKS